MSKQEVCRHCGEPPKPEMQRDHPFWPWVAVRVGPSGEWCHHYCSDECLSHADEYSRREWVRRRDSDLWAIG